MIGHVATTLHFVIIYLNNILIYTKNLEQSYIEAICYILDKLQKHFFFANLKKYWFHLDKIHFLGYVVLLKKINMKLKKSIL